MQWEQTCKFCLLPRERFPSDATTEIAYIGDSITLYFTGARTIRTYFEGTNDEVDDSITAKGEMQITYWGR